MYHTNADFVFTVTRDFVRSCQTPILVLPDDVPIHPNAVAPAISIVTLSSAQPRVSIYPWKANPDASNSDDPPSPTFAAPKPRSRLRLGNKS
jgi:hypothetical protein